MTMHHYSVVIFPSSCDMKSVVDNALKIHIVWIWFEQKLITFEPCQPKQSSWAQNVTFQMFSELRSVMWINAPLKLVTTSKILSSYDACNVTVGGGGHILIGDSLASCLHIPTSAKEDSKQEQGIFLSYSDIYCAYDNSVTTQRDASACAILAFGVLFRIRPRSVFL